MSYEIERLTGGLTPADPNDPRTFPAIWNDTADGLEGVEGRVTTNEGDITAVEGRVGTNEGDISQLQTDVANLDTDDVAEAGNLYYTDGRVQAVIAGSDTDDLSEGVVNLYFTDVRASDAAPVQSVNTATGDVVLDTDDVAEGSTNLYYTDGRAESAAPVQTVNTQSGTVVLDAADVGALPDDAKLGDLSDVVVTGATDGQLIAYNATADEWQLASAAGITTGDITALDLTWADF